MNYSTFGKICLAAVIPICISTTSVAQATELQTLKIKKQTSKYMDMGTTITRIAVGDPKIASVIQLPGSASEFLVVTKETPGSTAMFVWTIDGQRREYLIVVSPEDPGQAMLIEQAIGLPNVHVKMVDERVLLTGTVENQYEKNYALQVVRLFIDGNTESSLLVGSGFDMKLDTTAAKDVGRSEDMEAAKSESKGKIIDLIQILHPTQIRLEAQIIEINTDAAKDIGLRYGTDPSGSPGIFAFGENYPRTNTSISESYSYGGSNSYSGDRTDSYAGARNDAYSYNGYNGSGGGYTDDYNYDYNTSTNSNGNSNTYNNGYSNGYSNGRNSSFSRIITSSWYDMVPFANNPLRWIGQHFAPINVQLRLLVTKGKARILSRPSVMTLSGEQATIQIGGRIPYTSVNSNGSSNVRFENYGIILQFKPVVDEQKRINSMVHAEVSNISTQSVNGQPIITTRSADSVINLHTGQPIVIGGLMDSSETKTVQKIPLLGDIPIIGEFFKHTAKSRDKRELIIVVTPHLVGEDERSITPMSETMLKWYEQEQKYREAMENFDFKHAEIDSKSKETNTPFDD